MNSIVCCVCVGYSVALNFNVSAVPYTLSISMPVWAMSFYIVVWPEYYFFHFIIGEM